MRATTVGRPAFGERGRAAPLDGDAPGGRGELRRPCDNADQLRRLARGSRRLRFVQATTAGAGQQVAAAGPSEDDLARVAIASSSGVHAGPLAEFALPGVLAFARGPPRLQDGRAARNFGGNGRTRRSTNTALRTGSLSSPPGPASW
jgi:hypothetical protein